MMVTGVQPAGSGAVSTVQVAAVDPKEVARLGSQADGENDRTTSSLRRSQESHQPVVFPRQGVPMDQRPVSLRHHRATARYQRDGGDESDAAER
jgi:hypothetical protein